MSKSTLTNEINPEVASNPIFMGGQVTMQTLLTPETSKSFISAVVNFTPRATKDSSFSHIHIQTKESETSILNR